MKNTDKEEDGYGFLFVFYTLAESTKHRWNYEEFPQGWGWVGAGSTYPAYPVPSVLPRYEREEQFQGPMETKRDMISFLDNKFDELLRKGYIQCYKLSSSFSP